jgi:hypothetical protein
VPFAIEVDLAGRRRVITGHLLEALWSVRWHQWTEDPRKDAAAWRVLLASKPSRTASVETLSFPWKASGPEGLAPDKFATVAETRLRLDAGRYRIRVVSDDGVRVSVNGKLVIDNWTHHGSTEDTAELDLPAGVHEVAVEHFELVGWAHLAFRLEPIPR